MITQEQINTYCRRNLNNHSKLLFATLDHDYQADGYTVPIGTIIELRLYMTTTADLYVNNEWITAEFPYDAAI